MAHRGFSLVEVLVALVAFGLLAAAAGSIASSAIASHERLEEAGARIRAVQTTRALMKADLAQTVIRPLRDPYGGRRPDTFFGRMPQFEQPFLAFVRGGWSNPLNREDRPSLQYVEYELADDRLIRRSYARLDLTPDTPMTEAELLSGVKSLTVSFQAGGAWSQEWRAGINPSAQPPAVVAVEMDIEGVGRIRQLFRTAAQ